MKIVKHLMGVYNSEFKLGIIAIIMVIYTIGDSHSKSGWNYINDIQYHHIGPKLCYSIGRDGICLEDYFTLKQGDTVVFCFGEIDCRCHIHKHITKDRSYEVVIDNIVEKYFSSVKNAIKMYSNIKVCIYNVVPPIKKEENRENSEFPFVGSNQERQLYTLYFNQRLQAKCKEYGYIFFNVYNKYVDEEGFLLKELSDGNVHIENPIFIEEFIFENLQ